MFINSRLITILLVSLGIMGATIALFSDPSASSRTSATDINQYGYHSIDMSKASSYTTASWGHSAYSNEMVAPKPFRSHRWSHARSMSPTAYTNVSSIVSTPPSNNGGWRLHTTSSAEYVSFGGGNMSTGGSTVSGRSSSSTIAQANGSVSAPMFSTSRGSSLLAKVSTNDATAAIDNSSIATVSAVASIPSNYNSPLLSYNGGIITETYSGMSLSGNFGGRGLMRAPSLGQTEIGGFFDWLIANNKDNSEGQGPDSDGYWWFMENDLRTWFDEYLDACDNAGVTPQFDSWEDFMSWFNDKESNPNYRFPIPDGTIMLMLLVLGYALYIYRRSHKEQVAKTK